MIKFQVLLLVLNMADEFTNESFCTVIFDEFFLAGMAKDSVTRHLLKLLWWVHPKLPTARLHTLVKSLEPTSQVNLWTLFRLVSFINHELYDESINLYSIMKLFTICMKL